ncbi:MAG: polyprenol monophosphomannose synthase [Candidatus Palauibacterales bacterium]|nr:polyprenol monophosphomannose synthase [Candidatus Palauibacterales bacterium]MDP2583210.1 polyprenol monophosphomannose synthase [Candidatus Palauibacterales bacterium]
MSTARSEAAKGRGVGRALVVLPTYDEVENLAGIVPSILGADPRIDILVVDDASPDGTGALADRLSAGEPRLRVLHRTGKLGLGSAYLEGFRLGLAETYDVLIEMDADFSHDPKYLPALLEAVETCGVAVGSRYLRGVNVVNWPMSRLLLSWLANKYARWVTGLRVTDATSGFKCFRREVLEAIDFSDVDSTGYAFQIEMSFRAWKLGFEVREVPIVFVDRDTGESKMSGAIVREAVWRVWALRLKALLGRV